MIEILQNQRSNIKILSLFPANCRYIPYSRQNFSTETISTSANHWDSVFCFLDWLSFVAFFILASRRSLFNPFALCDKGMSPTWTIGIVQVHQLFKKKKKLKNPEIITICYKVSTRKTLPSWSFGVREV